MADYVHYPPPLEGRVQEISSFGSLREIQSEVFGLVGARDAVETAPGGPVIVTPGGGPLVTYNSSTVYDMTTVYASG